MSYLQKKSNRRILVVDDELDVRTFLKLFLEPLGWEVTTADSAAEALRLLKETHFFLSISDIAMPDMDGYEYISCVQKEGIPVHVAVMTGFGYNPNHTLVRIHRDMKYPCLFKPFNRKKVEEVVRSAFDNYHADIPPAKDTSDSSNSTN